MQHIEKKQTRMYSAFLMPGYQNINYYFRCNIGARCCIYSSLYTLVISDFQPRKNLGKILFVSDSVGEVLVMMVGESNSDITEATMTTSYIIYIHHKKL